MTIEIPLFQVQVDVEGCLAGLEAVLRSGYLGQGKVCEEFERELSTPGHEVLFVNSGTSALMLAFDLAGVGPGTEVVTTPMTCLATSAAIVKLGGTIVWADVDPWTGLLDPEDALRKVTPRTVAICGVDWGGQQINFNKLRKRAHQIYLVEDSAHRFPGKNPLQGDFVCYSFQAIKFLTTGDGGGLVCPSDWMYERAKRQRWFGLDRMTSASMRCYQQVEEAGWKFHGNDLAAAIGLANLKKMRELKFNFNRGMAEFYDEKFMQLNHVTRSSSFPVERMWWLYTVLVSDPVKFEAFMAERGIEVSQVHSRNDRYAAFRGSSGTTMPGLDFFSRHQTNIPVGSWVNEPFRIVDAVREWDATEDAKWSPAEELTR